MKNIIITVLVLMISFIPCETNYANISDYTFTQTTGTFTSIHTTGTYITGGCTSSVFGNLPIGFTFIYNGAQYTQFGLCCSGWISMGPGAPMTNINPLSAGSTNNVISPFSAQLTSTVAGDGIYYKTEGSAPNRILTVEWWSYGFWLNGFDEICFQIKLYETTNEINFVYTTNDEYSIRNIQVGLRGSSNADFINRQTTTNWSQTTAGTVNTASCLFSPGITPPAGLTFVFTPNLVGAGNNNNQIPVNFELYQNYPNPFNPATNIKFNIPTSSNVIIRVYDVNGKLVRDIYNGVCDPGSYSADFDAVNLASGIYYYEINASSESENIVFKDVKKMAVVK
ncbi:MAG: T9SS type A sorting domain-containing protein [Ignavibacteria bacterium]